VRAVPYVLNIPNALTVLRVVITYVHIALMHFGAVTPVVSAFLPLVGTLTDGLDGQIARRFNMKTKAGDFLDVVGDRIQELSYWIYFAYAGALPVFIPLFFAGRGIVVDALMANARAEGYTRLSFTGEGLAYWLVSSNASRAASALAKVAAFSLLAYGSPWGVTMAWAALAMNIIRGVPVIAKGMHMLS
jgi:cardiolipin synthase